MSCTGGTEGESQPHAELIMDTSGITTTSVITPHSGNLIETHGPSLHHQFQGTDIYIRQPMVMDTVVSLEQCPICSTFFEAPNRPIPQPDLNRMLCKALELTPELSFYRQYVPVCVNCANLLRKFDRLRVELEFVKTQLVTYVVESLTQVRAEGGSPLDGLKDQILNRWTNRQRDSRRKGKGNEGFTAAGQDGNLSWAACNNVMKSNPIITSSKSWNVGATTDAAVTLDSHASAPPDYPIDNEDGSNGGDEGVDDDIMQTQMSDNDAEFTSVDDINGKSALENVPSTSSKINLETQQASVPINNIVKSKRKKSKKKKRTSEGVAPLICVNCGRVFSQRIPFKGHTQVCTSDDLGMEKNCSICSEEHNVPWLFETWVEYKNHVECEHPFVKMETCSVCRLMFLPHGAKRHNCLQPYGGQVNMEAIFQCDRCDKRYNTRGNLVDHVRRSHRDEEHKCEVCGKVYGSPMLLNFHMKRHRSVVSKFRCTYCGVCLSTNYGLKEHVKLHTGEQPNACDVCGRKFTTLSGLRCHKLIHDNKKPHVCHICGRGFKLKATASRHISRHQLCETNITKRCPLCPKELFRKIWLLKKHMEIQHPGTPEQEDIFEKYKDVDDTPRDKRNIKTSLQTRGLAPPSSGRRKGRAIETDSEEESDDDVSEMSVDDAGDENDVKPIVEGGESENAETPATVSAPPSRQSARLMGKIETKKTLLVVLTKETPEKIKEASGK